MKNDVLYLIYDATNQYQLPVFLALDVEEAVTFLGCKNVNTFRSGLSHGHMFCRKYRCECISKEEWK